MLALGVDCVQDAMNDATAAAAMNANFFIVVLFGFLKLKFMLFCCLTGYALPSARLRAP
jgi:hypothetical protein